MNGKILNPLFGIPGLPVYIVISENDYTNYKRNDSQVFIGDITKNEFIVYMQKLRDHPIAIGHDPDGNGQIMTKFR
ncbi:hypothetical protein, partial [Enterococcus faecium]|uniref:hypothetical protein n=1 Tax=Enterococcus faecium TaxID=1352 RepID=UPI003AAB9F0B